MRTATLLLLVLSAGCATYHFPASISDDVMLVPADALVEFAVDEAGRVLEVEFHCQVDDVPQAVMRAVESVLPGGEVLACEKEYHGDSLFYEVAKLVDGRKVEIMVTADGRIHSREIEVAPSQVPDVVLENASKAVPGGSRTAIEEIRDGANNLIEYHVKVAHSGIKYKITLATGGKVMKLVREATAEIEVPVKR